MLPRLHAAQLEVKRGAARFNVLDCGRRWGKDVLLIDLAVETLLAGQPVGWFNPTYKMLTEVWRALRHLLQPLILRVDQQEHRMELITGGVLDMWSLDAYDTARGRKYRRVIMNEAAMVPHLQDAWEQTIRPMLTDYRGDAWFASTPKGRNYFHELYRRGLDTEQSEWRSFQYPTSANPHMHLDEIADARRDLPSDVFAQEYLAEFLENAGSVFRNIREALTAPRGATPEQHAGHVLVAGIDWAQKQDFTVISVVCADCKQEVALDRFNQIGWEFQRDRLQSVWRHWGIQRGYGEENSIGGPNIEALQNMKLDLRPFTTTSTTKSPLIQSLALCIERREIAWLNEPVATGELEAYEVRVNPVTGHMSYSAPPGQNDDTVIARALARKAALESSATGVFL